MGGVISNILATFISIPFLGYILLFVFFKTLTKNHRKSVQRAFDYSTLLFIIAVHFLIITIFGKSLLWFIILCMSFIGIVFAIIHWKTKGEVIFSLLFKGFWRFNFLLFFTAYFSLLIYGMIKRAVLFAG
ncbi:MULTISPECIES: DUF3397 domain-containing protein [unclassified Bacillus (in: firmicutes)]|uniref:DUF3397 domain-containing protein n=1 Tax=unclassified Bacillus (in: firmicutes) TaxID=185979 RepID=UPI0008E52252|nr:MULTISPECIES: DUF3397 domain-containing protein [unclassified Bacillus (in: firmicutes)]SFA75617.1 Protein of unknown function [Bacillus sp. UNCCL13]SFQ65699.1 Protein of unknown function [Bacillus sp. cl95]